MSQLKKYKRLKYLGKGSYGAAILVELRSNPAQRFVIKEIVIGHLKPAERNAAKSEAEVLHQMNHSNITMYIESFVENEKLYIVMENADGGDLSTAIQHRKKDGKYWDEEEVMRIFVQICLALQHVHNQNILHRDLKSQNIFLTLKGVVKLGDFGIAKVLDATDDQARTQIGTPYYLSPEICESKPYGRESDVWSLGVLLYEIIALEMPFQATSLPALVHRICVAEPNYSVVEKRYSAGLIELTKSMLMKDPQKRPSVAQIVKSEFIKTHISRLLSYTLRSGNAGVEMPLPLLARPKNLANLDAHEAEKVIESVHSQQREAESKEVRNQSNREAARIAEREKLRKFRNDMQQQRARGDAKNDDGKEEDNRVVYKPAPSRAVGANGRDLSPKSGRNVSPMSGRNLSPKGGRPVSPMGRNNNLSPKSNRPVSPTPKVTRPISPTPRVTRPVSPTPKVSRPYSPTPKSNRNMSPVNAHVGGGAHHSHHHHNNHNHNPNYNTHNGERALTPRGAAALRDKERKLAAAAAMKQGYAEVSALSQYAARDPRDHNAAAGALQRQPSQREDSARGNLNNGYGYPSQQQVQQQQHNQQQAAAGKANNANEYDSVARREFFANRAAAQAVKAKIEAYDRHGPNGAERMLMGGGGNAGGAPVRQHAPQQYSSHPSSRRGSEADQSYALQAGAHYDDDAHSVASRGSRQSYDGDEYSRMDPESRIAHIKAQKERERQRENAEKELQIKQAIEANRDARRSLQNAKCAVAFDIDLGGNAGPSMAKAPPLNIVRNASRQSLDDKPSSSPLADNNSPKSIHSDASSRLVRANVREDKGNSTPVESDSGKGRSKKSWGPPVAAKDIAKGITRYSEYSTPTSQMFAPPVARERSESVSSNAAEGSAVDMNKAYFDDEAGHNEEGNTARAAHRRDMSRDSIDQAALVGDEDEVVLRRLESKRNSQMQQRQQAKEMFKKLREKRRQQSEGKAGRVTGLEAKVSSVPHSVVSPIKRINPDEVTGLPRAANASPMQLRLMEVMSQVDLAQESVQRAITGPGESSARSRNANTEGASGRSRTNSEAKADGGSGSQANTPKRGVPVRKESSQQPQQAGEGRFAHIAEEEDEDELTSTLENWLTEQKRGVTTRRKHGHALDRDDETTTPIEDDLEGYATRLRYDRDSQAKNGLDDEVRDEKMDYYISGSLDEDAMYNNNNDTTGEAESEQSTQKIVRGKYMGNDVEVVGLQCMLAQALMGDED